MASEGRFTVNLPPEARLIWDMLRRGHTHTRVAMASIATWASMDRAAQDEIMMLVASVKDDKRPWSIIQDWADARREAADAEAALIEADDADRQRAKTKKRRKTAGARK